MITPSTTAFVFPGQGSQFAGMGRALAERYSVASQTFAEADDLFGVSLSELCFNGPEDILTDTYNAQPALFVAGIAALRVLYEAWDTDFRPAFTAGHSLGELTALTAAGAMSFADGLQLVRLRGELMRDAGAHSPGGMAAILGLEIETLEAICADVRSSSGGIVVVANDNCPGQIVLAGDEAALAKALELAERSGARRAVRLPVSIAAHSPLMMPIQKVFREAVDATPFHPPVIPIMGNTTAQLMADVGSIRAELGDQLTSPVRWTESVRAMCSAGVTTFIELGSKNVLTGLLKRIDRQAAGLVVDSPEGIEELIAQS